MAFQKELERFPMQSITGPNRWFDARRVESIQKSMICGAFGLLVGGLLCSESSLTLAKAAPPIRSPFFGESLRRTPLTLSIEDQTLDQVLLQLLQSVNLGAPGKAVGGAVESGRRWSLWLDRRVDSSELVTMTAGNTPASRIVLDIAESKRLAVYPLPGVFLLGRPDWVQGVLVNLPEEPRAVATKRKAEALVNVVWPTGTPAAAVLGLVLSSPAGVLTQYDPNVHRSVDWLPHDVWRSGRLESVERSLAVGLVLGQFNLRLKHGHALESLFDPPKTSSQVKSDSPDSSLIPVPLSLPPTVQPWRDEDLAKEFLQAYPSGDSALTIREFLNKQKRRVSVRVSGDQLLVRANAAKHLGVIGQLWKAPLKKRLAVGNAPVAQAVFDLKLVNKPVAVVLRQLAGAAGKKIRFASGTESLQEQLVSLDAVKQTLETLAIEVAKKVGLEVDWNDNEVVVTKS